MQERTFNRRRRQLFRRRISGAEVLAALLGAVGWVAAQRDAYDPAERDLSFAVLQAQSMEDRLYRRPLVAWVEPGSGPAGAAVPAPRLGAFPPAIVADGWRVSTRLQEFGPDNLYEKINGAAEQYLRFGFQRLHYVGLRREGGVEELSIELYDQGDFAGGLGIFSAQRDPTRPLRREGALTYYETAVGAIGVMGRWFFKVAGSTESPALQAKTRQLVAALATLPVAEGEVPYGYRVLTERLGLPFGAVAYQSANAFQFAFAQDFWFGTIGDSTGGHQPASGRFFLHRAAGPAEAAELYERLLTEQRFDYDVLVEDEERAVLRHRFLKNHFALALAGPVVYGVENVMARADVEPALRRLEQALAASPEQRRER
jgi:hypothetical protein